MASSEEDYSEVDGWEKEDYKELSDSERSNISYTDDSDDEVVINIVSNSLPESVHVDNKLNNLTIIHHGEMNSSLGSIENSVAEGEIRNATTSIITSGFTNTPGENDDDSSSSENLDDGTLGI